MSLAFSNKVAFSSATDAALVQSEYIALVAEPNLAGRQAGELADITAIGLDSLARTLHTNPVGTT